MQQALPAIILAALRRFGGAVLFPGPRTSSSLGAPFWPSGLTVRRSRPPTAAAELRALGLSDMIFSLVRITGQGWQPNEFVTRFKLENCTVWHQGDTLKFGKGRTHTTTGFAFSLPDAESWATGLPLVMSMLRENHELFQTVAAMGLKAELSIGVTVGEKASFAPSLDFSLELISELHDAKVAMEINSYPTSDE